MNPKLKDLRAKAMALPLQPGVYIMKNAQGEIIYIGKAKKLKNRVSQYFGSQNNHTEKVRRMVDNVDDFDYIITDSEFECLILECSLIKQHAPKYNILLKDDKGYSYIRVTNEEWRRLSYVLQKADDGARYIGPYKSSYYVKSSVEEANKIFGLPTCNRRFPEDFGRFRPCLNYHIKQCCAPCTGRVKLKDYNERVESALEYLSGDSSKTLKELQERMTAAADALDFERAARYRDQIAAMKKMRDKQKVVDIHIDELDVIALAREGSRGSVTVLRFNDSRMYDTENFIIDDVDDEVDLRSQFILRYYTLRNEIPSHIALDGGIEDIENTELWLTEKKGKRVYINIPQRGVQKNLVDMCQKNAYEALGQLKGVTGKQLSVLDELKNLLGLDKLPEYIESYDISNFAGADNVAGMVVFENARPLKSAYRKFKIKSFSGQDDYGSMAEVLTRRLDEYKKAQEAGETDGFGRLPDLILLDGGKGQVGAVLPVIDASGLSIPVFGMVKDDRHRTRAIVSESGEIAIRPNRAVYTFITNIQDEVHRYAIGFNRQQRKKALGSSLEEIPGIGRKRAKELMRYFRTIKNISNASTEELEQAPGMTHPAAVSVYNYFHEE
ncbi:MAG: excinuclease ABC subunit UvrC [Ruminococcus sp.]|uniref:excinuclease ABC subunit UvrC n=1 Tax=Ruminococcus sp. TaxID=41978 RepID=UPI002873C519|nr:excinuclease ABC subunit UvrC [Ruminococcus sp.]MBQ3284697.1 excinuclease ABC subunit UvrC [Ruminococcus sp.]